MTFEKYFPSECYRPFSRCGHLDFTHRAIALWFHSIPTRCNKTEVGRNNSLVPCEMNVIIHYYYTKQGAWPRWWQLNKGLHGYFLSPKVIYRKHYRGNAYQIGVFLWGLSFYLFAKEFGRYLKNAITFWNEICTRWFVLYTSIHLYRIKPIKNVSNPKV